MDMDEATNASSKTENDVDLQEANGTSDNSSGGIENGAPEAREKPVQMDTDSKTGGPVEKRYKEWTERGPAIDQLAYCINSFREAVLSNDPKFDQTDLAEKQKVINECGEAESMVMGEETAAGCFT